MLVHAFRARGTSEESGAWTLLALIVLAALLGLFGVRTDDVTARDRGITMKVHYARTARAGLDGPLDTTLRRNDGFDSDVIVAISTH